MGPEYKLTRLNWSPDKARKQTHSKPFVSNLQWGQEEVDKREHKWKDWLPDWRQAIFLTNSLAHRIALNPPNRLASILNEEIDIYGTRNTRKELVNIFIAHLEISQLNNLNPAIVYIPKLPNHFGTQISYRGNLSGNERSYFRGGKINALHISQTDGHVTASLEPIAMSGIVVNAQRIHGRMTDFEVTDLQGDLIMAISEAVAQTFTPINPGDTLVTQGNLGDLLKDIHHGEPWTTDPTTATPPFYSKN